MIVRDFSQEEWNKTVSMFSELSLMQTWEYGQAKAQTDSWKVERAIFLKDNDLIGAVQLMVRRLPMFGGGFVWVNRGPMLHWSIRKDLSLLFAMLEELRRRWVDEEHMYLRIALPITEGNLSFRALEVIGYKSTGFLGWGSARLDLSLPVETLRKRLDQKWRNCLNKAERLGLVVEIGSDDSTFAGFLTRYREMLSHRKFRTSVTPILLSRLQKLLPSDRKLLVFTAWQNRALMGSVLVARYGNVAEYLAACVNETGRAVNASHFLLWHAVVEVKKLGYRWFDVGGMAQESTPPGIFHFKAGLGGIPYRFMEELEAYHSNWLSRVVRWGVHWARRSRHR